MRKLTVLAAASLLITPVVSQAKTLNELLLDKGIVAGGHGGDHAKVHYKGGTRLDFGDVFDVKMNLQIQSKYTYSDFDESEATGRDDTSSFSMRRVRLVFTGNLLNKTFSFKLQNDFASDSGGGDLKDAWLQWNHSDVMKLRMGQMKVPWSRQQLVSSSKLQFINRSGATDFFTDSGTWGSARNNGLLLHGEAGGMANYAVGVYNGNSIIGGTREGINSGGVDNNHTVQAMVHANFGEYGSRGHEGAYGHADKGFGATVGVAAVYGQGEEEGADFDEIGINADIGARCGPFSAQGEFFWRDFDFDDISGDSGEGSDVGFYVQSGYFVVPDEWEIALRFGYTDVDDDNLRALNDEETEYSGVIGYYIDGHRLKLQTGITIENLDPGPGTDDLTDFRYELQLSGYF